jgi:hypothetical protein
LSELILVQVGSARVDDRVVERWVEVTEFRLPRVRTASYCRPKDEYPANWVNGVPVATHQL